MAMQIRRHSIFSVSSDCHSFETAKQNKNWKPAETTHTHTHTHTQKKGHVTLQQMAHHHRAQEQDTNEVEHLIKDASSQGTTPLFRPHTGKPFLLDFHKNEPFTRGACSECVVLVLLLCVTVCYLKGMCECVDVFALCCIIIVLYCYCITQK